MTQSASLKALLKQYQLMAKNPDYKVSFPDKNRPTLWHISFRGPPNSPFQDGIYHTELDLAGYPDSPPAVMFVHENGSFSVNQHICIVGLTHYHPEGWTAGTSVEAVVTAMQMYMNLDRDRNGVGMIPSINGKEAQKLAKESLVFKCRCGTDHALFGK